MTSARTSDHDIDPRFLARWSPRAFTGVPIAEAEVLSLLEAARWAPSAFNLQPWRFVYGLAGTAAFAPLLDLLIPFNQGWARRASALIFVLSDGLAPAKPGQPRSPSYSHSFDSGAAWAMLALQAGRQGLHAHAMTGFDTARAPEALGAPEGYRVEAAVAVGPLGDPSVLPEALQARETPSSRLPLSELAFVGRMRPPGPRAR